MLNRILYLVSILYSANAYGNTDIFPIQDVISCYVYVLSNISGSGLTSSVAYYSHPGGTGIQYLPGDSIHTSGVYYAFDQDGMGKDEECFFVQIINHLPDLSQLHDDSACAYYVLPYFETPSISGYAGYYTDTNAQGVRFQQGDAIISSISLYAYDGYEACSVEKAINIIVHDPPVFDSIYHQYGCHEYTFRSFAGTNVFVDSLDFLFEGQQYQVDDKIIRSGEVEVVAQNGTCITKKTFELSVVDEISIDPIGDTLICGPRFLLPQITGNNITENAKYYPQNGGTGKDYLPGEYYAAGITGTIYALDFIPGTDCIDEEDIHINTVEETKAYKDFKVVVCRGLKYNVYELLLARNIDAHGNKIFPIDNQVILENVVTFNTGTYQPGEYRFYVVDSTGAPCINDTAIMTVITTDNCINTDKESILCTSPDDFNFLLSTNMADSPDLCLGGYFLDENYNHLFFWNQKFDLDRTIPREYKFYYVLTDINGKRDTSIVTIKIVDIITLKMTGSDTLCKGECISVRIEFLDNDYYQTPVFIQTPNDLTLFNVGVLYDSLTHDDDIHVCFISGGDGINTQNPDTIFLPISDQEYKLEVFALELKECQRDPEPIYFVTREDNTFYFEETLCPGGSVEFHGQKFDETRPKGEILLSTPATNGCDSFIYVNLSFYAPATKVIKEEICNTDTIIINCIAYTAAFSRDTQILKGGGIYGCDSTIIIDLNFTKPDKIYIDTTLCEGQRINIGDKYFESEGLYSGVIKKKNLCDSLEYEITIRQSRPEKIHIDWTDPTCFGDSTIITIDSSYQNVSWSTGETGNQTLITGPGEYKVTLTNTAGCQQDTTFEIIFQEGPQITGDYFYQGTINEPIQFNLTSNTGPVFIKWIPETGLNCDTCLMPIATISHTQQYHYIAVDENGCLDEGAVEVEIIFDSKQDVYIPNIFNPLSQSFENRVFFLSSKGISRTYDLSIFDRWGGLLYNMRELESNQRQGGWNGMYRNTLVQSGVYIYKITLEGIDPPIIGTITVIY
ncbi:MAG TPA: hypothetical protein VFG10_13240 [Saprospiraceae bacterium]|nr:hypothetical protein [Saprospiraceae bacterium]